MQPDPNRAEAERLLGVAEKLLDGRDFDGAKEFAALAQETDPLTDGSDQILAVAEVLLASEKRVGGGGGGGRNHDWYSILQIGGRSDDQDLIKRQYRRIAILLHPEKNKLPYAHQAFRLVGEAWAVLSDPARKSDYDLELISAKSDSLENDGSEPAEKKLPVKRGPQSATPSSFWTGCPYCCRLYEYPKQYEECCLRCQSCKRAFHAVGVPSLPPLIPGKDAYYCPWGGFHLWAMPGAGGNWEGFPTWPNLPPTPPPTFSGYGMPSGNPPPPPPPQAAVSVAVVRPADPARESGAPKKRGRPRKNLVPS